MTAEELCNADVYEAEISKIWLELSEAKPETTMRDAVIEWKRRQSNQTTSQIGAVMNADVKNKIAEVKPLLDQLDDKQKVTAGGPYGSDLSVLIDKIFAWLKTLDINAFSPESQKAMLGFLINTVLPKVKDYTPTIADLAIDVLTMFLKQWHDGIVIPTPTA
jgi:hypothetical protein